MGLNRDESSKAAFWREYQGSSIPTALILIINRTYGDTKHGKYEWTNKEAGPRRTGSGD
jgi:hypothetical protein